MAYIFSNNAVSTLDGAIDDNDTSLDVDDASAFPDSGDFTIIIESEILLVTAVSTNTFTVARGQEGTAAAGHANGVGVRHILTADFLNDVVLGITPPGVQTFQPTWTNTGTATFTTNEGRYFQFGKMVFVTTETVVNSAGSGGGLIGFDLPVAPSSSHIRDTISGYMEGFTGFSGGTQQGAYGVIQAGATPTLPRLRSASGININRSDFVSACRITMSGWYEAA